jgi:YD repeat-containing protein
MRGLSRFGRARLGVAVALLSAGIVLVFVLASSPAAGGCRLHVRVRAHQPTPSRPRCELSASVLEAQALREDQSRRLASASAKAQRAQSRMAFHGLGSVAAARLAQRDFGSRIGGANPAAAIARAGKLIRYIGNYRALVRMSKRRMTVFTSSVPLRAAAGGGGMRPVDLDLRSQDGAFSAINPLQPVSISRYLGGGVIVGSAGVRVQLVGSDVPGAVEGGQSVFFANVGVDEDVSVAPTISGAELSTVLRSQLSPREITYRVTVPQGAKLSQQGSGAAVTRGGQILATIPAPSAIDAQDTFVPVTMRVAGDELVVQVARSSQDVAYPLLVDPRIIVTRRTPGWHFYTGEEKGPKLEGPQAGVLTAPAGAQYGPGEIKEFTPAQQDFEEKQKACPECGLVEYDYVYAEPQYKPSAQWEWRWAGHTNRFREGHLTEIGYYGVSLTPNVASTSEPNGSDYVAGTGDWSYQIGCYGQPSYGSAPPATIVTTEGCQDLPRIGLTLEQAPSEGVWWGAPGGSKETNGGRGFSIRVAPTTVATTLSVEAVVVAEARRLHRRHGRSKSERYGLGNEGAPNLLDPCEKDPVDCATGNLTETQTDLQVPGRGVGLTLARTYNAEAAASEYSPGPFGYGWSWTFGAHLTDYGLEGGGDREIVEQRNGSTVAFTDIGGQTTTEPGVQATLSESSDGQWVYTLPNQTVLGFNGRGDLVSDADRNGNVTTVAETCESREAEGESGCRIIVTDPAGRKLRLYENSEGLVERATDPMGNTVRYGYEDGNLVSVTEPGESTPRWRFRYDSQHRLTEIVDGRGGATTNEYDSQSRVIKQTGPRGDTHRFEYREIGSEELEGASDVAAETSEEEDFLTETNEEEEELMREGYEIVEGQSYTPPEYTTQLTDEGTGAVRLEHFNSEDELSTITDGYGTPQATARSFTYDSQGNLTSETNGEGHTTHYDYDAEGNKTSETNPAGDETEWRYDSTHDVIVETTPRGETTTIQRDPHGNPIEVSRPAPGGETQTTRYSYNAFGELTGMTDPLDRTWRYEYDGYGDRVAEIAPDGSKRTYGYNLDSQETSTTSARGNVPGGEPARYTTIIERDAQGRVVRVIEPLE